MQAWGGPTIGSIANHIVPDTIFDNQLADYAPVQDAGDHGSVAKAKAAMKGSKYDTCNNGMCDASACKNVLMIADTRSQSIRRWSRSSSRTRRRSASRSRSARSTARTRRSRRRRRTSRSPSGRAGARTTPTPLTFFEPLFDGRDDHPDRQHELLARRDHARRSARRSRSPATAPYNEAGVGVRTSTTLDKCAVLADQPRLTCYENLDKYLMTKVVPWVPYLQVVRHPHHELERHALPVRPVHRHTRLREHRGRSA